MEYAKKIGTLTRQLGETAKAVVVATTQDRLEEEVETFTLSLGEAMNGTVTKVRQSATEKSGGDDRAAGDRRASPAGIVIWTEELGYLSGERLRLYLATDPKGDQSDYTVFFYPGAGAAPKPTL